MLLKEYLYIFIALYIVFPILHVLLSTLIIDLRIIILILIGKNKKQIEFLIGDHEKIFKKILTATRIFLDLVMISIVSFLLFTILYYIVHHNIVLLKIYLIVFVIITLLDIIYFGILTKFDDIQELKDFLILYSPTFIIFSKEYLNKIYNLMKSYIYWIIFVVLFTFLIIIQLLKL